MQITIRVVHEVSPGLERALALLAQAMGAGPERAVRVPKARGAAAGDFSPPAAAPAAAAGLSRQNAPAAAAPARRMRNSWRTEERQLLLEADWPRGRPVADIRAQMEGMDGPALPRAKYVIATWAHELNLARPGMEKRKWRTPARLAILQRDWSLGVTREAIAAEMNALPGPAVPPERLKVWAAEQRLVRPEGFLSEIRAGKRQGGRKAAAVPAVGEVAQRAPAAVDDDADGQQEGHAPPRAPEVPGPSPAAAAGATPEVPRVPPAVVPVPVAPAAGRKPPPLPEPEADGRVYACFRDLAAWAGFYGIAYDGTNIDRLNRLRTAKGLPEVAQRDDAPPVSGAAGGRLAVAA